MTLVCEANKRMLSRPYAVGSIRTASACAWIALGLLLCSAGCGTTKSFTATEQLLVSDAVDATVSKIDFRPLSGHRVYLDNTFLPKQALTPQALLVHSEYVTSSLRQQMLAAGVFLCEKKEEAEIIVEARMGALGFDGHSVTYGIPASNSLSTAASTLSGAPPIPLLPELSFAKKEAKSGAAKIALFAYQRQTLEPVWQSGIARSTSTARDTWVLGVGPLQNGTIYEGTRFAGSRVLGKKMSEMMNHEADEPEALVDYKRSQVFTPLGKPASNTETASNEGAPPAASTVTPASASTPTASPAAPTSKTQTTAAAAASAAPAKSATPAQPAQAQPTPSPPAEKSATAPPAAASAAASPAPLPSPANDATLKHIDDLPKK